jgi:hypothetical protein
MGRGRQKAKQQKIARKLKYLTTDTNYDELAKELRVQEQGSDSADSFANAGTAYADDSTSTRGGDRAGAVESKTEAQSPVDDDLDEYAKWAAEAAAKATSDELPVTPAAKPKPHRIPMPVPSALSKNGALHKTGAAHKTGVPQKVAGGAGAGPRDAGASAADESGNASKTGDAKTASKAVGTGSAGTGSASKTPKATKTAKAAKPSGGTARKSAGKASKTAKAAGASASRSAAASKAK